MEKQQKHQIKCAHEILHRFDAKKLEMQLMYLCLILNDVEVKNGN